jgi:hypothetical protein
MSFSSRSEPRRRGPDHRALAHGDRGCRQLRKKRRKAVLVDHALRDRRVAAPGEAGRGHNFAIDGGVGDSALFVTGLVQHAPLVVGDGLVAPHLPDVDVVAEAVHGLPLVLRLRDADVHYLVLRASLSIGGGTLSDAAVAAKAYPRPIAHNPGKESQMSYGATSAGANFADSVAGTGPGVNMDVRGAAELGVAPETGAVVGAVAWRQRPEVNIAGSHRAR